METDKELLELAAKAAGITSLYWTPDGQKLFRREGGIQKPWNPLTDDGDALRLAVKIKAVVDTDFPAGTEVEAGEAYALEPHNDDPYAATRRAIVRAAAEIGRGME